jgi:hypothetical protein
MPARFDWAWRIDLVDLHPRGVHALADGACAGQQPDIALGKFDAALVSGLHLLAARGDLLVEEGEALPGLGAVTRQIFLLEDVDQLLRHLLRDARIGTVRHARIGRLGADVDHAGVGLRHHGDIFTQRRDLGGDIARAGYALRQIGFAHDLFQIFGAGERAAHALQFLLRLDLGDADLVF